MTGHDFLQVAQDLAGATSEPYWRSATSRAYYAAFHVARAALEHSGIPVPENTQGHERVIRCLNHAGDPELSKAATGLGTLRSSRIAADYRLLNRSFAQAQAAFDLQRARDVVLAIEKSALGSDHPEQAATAIREYLRRTNQWHN